MNFGVSPIEADCENKACSGPNSGNLRESVELQFELRWHWKNKLRLAPRDPYLEKRCEAIAHFLDAIGKIWVRDTFHHLELSDFKKRIRSQLITKISYEHI